MLSDKNPELINLYRGIRYAPSEVWRLFCEYPSGKRAYYRARQEDTRNWNVITRAARTLYLNRTCFKGMWRQNSQGMFNVGYGGQSRRWAIEEEDLVAISKILRGTTLPVLISKILSRTRSPRTSFLWTRHIIQADANPAWNTICSPSSRLNPTSAGRFIENRNTPRRQMGNDDFLTP